MGSFGRNIEESTGRQVMVSADGNPDWKAGGVTIDWDAVDPVTGTDETLDDETVVKVGDSFLRYGTVLNIVDSTGKATPTDAPRRGECYILNETVVKSEPGSDHPPVIEGGLVWGSRLNVAGAGLPDLDDVLAAFPRLRLAEGSNTVAES